MSPGWTGFFWAAAWTRSWRFVVSIEAANVSFVHRFIMLNRLTFPVDTDSPYAVKRMAEHLQAGGKLVIFPEGRLSRTGALMKLFDGTGFLLCKTRAKVVTCYLRGAHRLPFSPNPNRKQMVCPRHRPFQRAKSCLRVRIGREREPVSAAQIAGDDLGAGLAKQKARAVKQFHPGAGAGETAFGR